MKTDQKRWNERFREKDFTLGKDPSPFLKKYIHRLPKGKALDVAAGEGRNAIFLAQHGCDVDAIDISEKGLNKARRFARDRGVRIRTFVADLDECIFEEEKYDLIANFYFLKRSLVPKLKKALKKGGKIIFETYTLEHRTLNTSGPKQTKYFLRPNELLRLFKDFHILFYRAGIFKEGGRRKAIASLIAEKIKP